MDVDDDRGPREALDENGYELHHPPLVHDHGGGQRGDEPDPQGERVNYVPSDLCIVIETADLTPIEHHYANVLNDLNNQFNRANFLFEAKEPIGPQNSPGADPGRYTQEPGYPSREDALVGPDILPWIPLPSTGDADVAQALLFFRVRSRGGMDQPVSNDPALDAFTAINARVDRDGLKLAQQRPYRIVAPTLNWFHPAAGDHSQGCPASRPEPSPKPSRDTARMVNWRFRIPRQLRAPDEEQADEVMIVVLDTCPDADVVDRAVERFAGNTLLREVRIGPNEVNIESELSLSRNQATYVATPPPDGLPSMESWHLEAHPDPSSNWNDFRMDDHGLFVSGIIRDVAPRAKVELIRVLGAFGVGHTQGITTVLGHLRDRLEKNPDLRLIVNLSLVAAIPPKQWDLPHVYEAMGIAIRKLVERGALVIASAGNEDLGTEYPNLPALPMFPARMGEVLSVASLNRHDQKAWFADRVSLFGVGNGVTVFGGDILTPSDHGHHPLIDMRPDDGDIDAVAGIFSAPGVLPLDVLVNPSLPIGVDRANRTGWTYWSGSSFATPVISAIAANLWAGHGQETARQIRDRILTAADTDPAFRAYEGGGRIFVDQVPV